MMAENSDPIASLQAELRQFAERREWQRYHTPRNLAALISSEAGELLAHYRWGDDPAGSMAEVSEEVADVFLGILRFADVAEIDLVDVSRRKLERNALKYPEGRNDPEPLRMPGSIDR